MSDIWGMLKNVQGELWWGDNPFADRLMITYPAYKGNYYSGVRYEMRECHPICLVWHEPQEPADNYESTPVWFQNPDAHGSTHSYGDNDGDRYSMVPLNRAPIANGWTGDLPLFEFNDGGPEFGNYSINQQSASSEEEGYTSTIAQTFTEAQWQGAVDYGVLCMIMYEWPRTPQRVGVAHAYLASDRSDGIWIVEQSGIPQEIVRRVTKLEQEVNQHGGYIWNDALRINHLEAENEARKGEVQSLYSAMFVEPLGLRPRVEALEAQAGIPTPVEG